MKQDTSSAKQWPSTKKREGYDVIVLVRHGESALSRKIHLTAQQYRLWWAKYTITGIAAGQTPPAKLKAVMQNADSVICSSLERAQESAALARGRAADRIDPELMEAALPPPSLGPLKLRPKSWGTLSRVVWFLDLVDSEERVKPARARAKRAADSLALEAEGGRLIVALAHGWFNRMVATQLRKSGWKMTKNQGDLHWKYRRFERKTTLSKTDTSRKAYND